MIYAHSLNSISSEHHDQGGQPNGNQEHRPIHDVEAKEPSHLGFILIVRHVRARCFRLCDGSRSVMSNKQRQREVARTDYGYAAKRQIADDIANPQAERVRLIIPTTGSQWASLSDVRNAPNPTSALTA